MEECRQSANPPREYRDISLQQRAVELLKAHNLTVATAESCTAGYIAKRITDISGASEVFASGVVSYSCKMKHKILGVDNETLEQYGAVSGQTAVQMAKGVRKLCESDIGLSITGLAGPNSDESGKPVGLAYIAMSDKNGEYVDEIQLDGKYDREYMRRCFSDKALEFLIRYLEH